MIKGLHIGFKTFIFILLFFASLGVFIVYAIQWSEFQTSIAQKSAKWLSEKLGSTVTVGNVRIHWFDEIHLEDVNIKDLSGRDMIFVREIYVNAKTNFKLDFSKPYVNFDDNLDFVMLREPNVRLEREDNGDLNIDRWIANINDKLASSDTASSGNSRGFSIDEAVVEYGTFKLIDKRKSRMATELFDYYNFKIDRISGKLKDFYIHRDTVQFVANDISGIEERSKLTIKKINTNFLYTRNLIELDRLYGLINNSVVKNYLAFHYDKPADLGDFNNKVRIEARLHDAELESQDLGRFSDYMYNFKERYKLTGDVIGYVKDLYVNNLNLNFGEGSTIAGKMNFKGLPIISNTLFHFELANTEFINQDLKVYLGEEIFAKYIKMLGKINFDGVFEGTANNFFVDAQVKSDQLGIVLGKMTYDLDEKTKLPNYLANIHSASVDLGKLSGNEIFEKISFTGNLRGGGNSISNANIDLEGDIGEVDFDGYHFKNIHVDGLLKQSKFDGKIGINDPNLKTTIVGLVDFNPVQNSFNISGKVENANLKELGYSKESIRLETSFDLDFDGNKLDDWIGEATFKNTFAYAKDKNLVVDDLSFVSQKNGDERTIGIRSEFLDANIKGDFVPSVLIQDLAQLQKEYALFFSGTEADRTAYYSKKKLDSLSRDFSAGYHINLKNTENLFAFMLPELSISKDAEISGQVKIQSASQFLFYAEADTIIYGGNSFYQNEIDFFSSKGWISPKVLTSLVLKSESQKLANNVETEKIDIGVSWGDGGTIDFDGGIRQKNTQNRAQLFGSVAFSKKGFTINMNPRNSMVSLLDYHWQFDPQNQITIVGQEIQFEDFRISNENQSIALSGFISPDSSKQLFAAINHFDLRALEPLAALQIEGIAEGDVSMSNFYGNPILLSNGMITDFKYKNILVGNVNAVIDWDNALNKVKIESRINRLGVEIMNVTGTYDPEQEGGVNLVGKLDDAELEIFGTFVDNIFSDLSGMADGELHITGSPQDLIARGEVALRNGRLRINATGGYLYFNDTILFTEEGFVAKPGGFKVYDAPVNGHEAYLTGGIFNGGNGIFLMGLHGYMKDPDGFLLLNSTLEENDAFYGKAYAGGDIHLTGGFNDLVISANLVSKRNTKVTIPLDGDADIDTEKEAIPFAEKPVEVVHQEEGREDKNTKKVVVSGVKMALNLTLTPDAECEIIIDRRNNDQLNVLGNGRLSIEYDTRDEHFSLSGPYIVTSGKYDFSFQNLSSIRKFDILDGSRINWTGNPYNANLDMKASYTVNVDMSTIWSRTSDDESDVDKSRYPVEVVVSITDQLATPNITYNLNFDNNKIPNRHHTDLYAFEQRLRDDEQLLSKNVSFLIAFNSLYSDTNGLLKGFENDLIFQNLSSLLSNQIGNLANKLDPNLELGVSLGDFRQTILNNMQLNISYKFLNDRAKFSSRSSYSNGYGINDQITIVNQGQLTVGGEFEYLLTDDGVWRLRINSRSVPSSNYSYTLSNAASGNVLVSGVNILFSRNFNTLFSKKKFPKGVAKKEEEDVFL